MSYELKITVKKSDVIAEVNKTCAYIGARTVSQDGGNLYKNLSTSKYDAEMLQRFWDEACAILAQAGKEYVRVSESSDEGWTVTYALPDKYNTALDGSVRQFVFSYIVWYVLAQWLETCGMAAAAQSYGQSAQMFLSHLDSFLSTRTTSRSDLAEGEEGDNQLGDTVDSMAGDDNADGNEPEGDNQLGDTVDSMAGDDNADGNEPEGDNQLGDSLPQGYGNFLKVQKYSFAR